MHVAQAEELEDAAGHIHLRAWEKLLGNGAATRADHRVHALKIDGDHRFDSISAVAR